MPEKLDRCVRDVKAQGKDDDSAWAICVSSTGEKPHHDTVKEEVAKAIGMVSDRKLPDPEKMRSHPADATTSHDIKEHHNPLDIPFGYEVYNETKIKRDNTHENRHKLDRISEKVRKQILETQITECPCNFKKRASFGSK